MEASLECDSRISVMPFGGYWVAPAGLLFCRKMQVAQRCLRS